jgi:hypothetical protein
MQEIYSAYMTVEMPDNSVWKVPVALIANHRANHYKHEFNDDLKRSLTEDTLSLFEFDEYNIFDWAANNMNWSDVVAYAEKISDGECDYEDGWTNGDKEIID